MIEEFVRGGVKRMKKLMAPELPKLEYKEILRYP